MSFWGKVGRWFVRAAQFVANRIIRPIIATVRRCVDWVEDIVDRIYKDIKGVIDSVKGWVNDLGVLLITKDTSQYEELNEQILANLLDAIKSLLDRAKIIEKEERMQEFENFARLRVSAIFLKGLSKDLQNLEDLQALGYDKREFLNLTRLFITGEIADDSESYEKFDNMAQRLYNKDLFEFGAEAVLIDYKNNHNVLKQEYETVFNEFDSKKNEIVANEKLIELPSATQDEKDDLAEKQKLLKQEVDALEKEVKKYQDRMEESSSFLLSIQALLSASQNHDELSSRDRERLIEVGNIFIAYRQGDIQQISESDRQKIYEFNAIAISKNWASYKISDQLETEI